MADTKLMSFAEVTPVGTDNVLVGNSTNGVRRAQLSNLKAAIGGIVKESLNTDGYIKYANGLIIQWGATELSGENKTITFPIAFTNAPSVSVTPEYGNTSNECTLRITARKKVGLVCKNMVEMLVVA